MTINGRLVPSKAPTLVGTLLVLAFALALLAHSASASAASWYVGGSPSSSTEATEIAKTTSSIALEIPNQGLTFSCGAMTDKGGHISGGQNASEEALNLTGCSVASAAPKCQVKSSGQSTGTIALGSVKSSLVIGSDGNIYERVQPSAGAVFTTVVVEKKPGQTCAIAGSFPLGGSFAARIGSEAVELGKTFSAAGANAAGTALTYGGGARAVMSGAVSAVLTGEGRSQAWGAR